MKDKRLIIVIGAVAVVAILGCCVVIALGALLLSRSSKPEHHGVYLKQGRSFAEMKQYRGVPARDQVTGIPSTSHPSLSLVLWDLTINLSYLELYEPASDWYGEYTTTRSGEMIELTPRSNLSPGRYCLIQGDPLGLPTSLSYWCFEVE